MGSALTATNRLPLAKTPPKQPTVVRRRISLPKESRAPQSKLTAKGQMTIPKEIRDHLGLKPGDRVKFFLGPGGRVTILPNIPITVLRGIFAGRVQRPVTLEEMDEAIADGMVERYLLSNQP